MSFYLAIAYLIVEYMRPQSMYASLSGVPFAMVITAAFGISFILEGRNRFNSNKINILLLVYLLWFFMSTICAYKSDYSWQLLIDFTKWVVIYFLLINTINNRQKLYIFVVIFLILNFRYSQFASRIWIGNGFYSDPRGINNGGGIGSGFFSNPNDFGIAMVSVIGISYYMIFSDTTRIKDWFDAKWMHLACFITMVLAILASSSRGAALGLGCVMLGAWYKGKHKVNLLVLLGIMTAVYISLIPADNWARFQKMGSKEDGSSKSRLALWNAGIRMANENPMTGVGPNNFVYVNTLHYSSEYREVQHNVYIQAASELGYPGLILFIAMMFHGFRNQIKSRAILYEKKNTDPFLYGLSHGIDLCLFGFAANGMFITVLYYPFFWMLLVLSTSLHDVVRELDYSSTSVVEEIT